MLRGIGNALFSNFKWARSCGNFGQLLEQVITPRGPILVSRKLAVRHEPNIGLRCCSTCSKITSFSDEKYEVLSGEPLFHRIGPRVSQDGTFSKNQRSYSKETLYEVKGLETSKFLAAKGVDSSLVMPIRSLLIPTLLVCLGLYHFRFFMVVFTI